VLQYRKQLTKARRRSPQGAVGPGIGPAAQRRLDHALGLAVRPRPTRGIEHIDMVPNLSAQNLMSVEISKNFMPSHGYIKNDFDVRKWAAPEFLEQAARALLEEQWKKVTTAKLPEAADLLQSGRRIG
jgi:hypothetical protein